MKKVILLLLILSIQLLLHAGVIDSTSGFVDLVERTPQNTNEHMSVIIRQYPVVLSFDAQTPVQIDSLNTFYSLLSSTMNNQIQVTVYFDIRYNRIVGVK